MDTTDCGEQAWLHWLDTEIARHERCRVELRAAMRFEHSATSECYRTALEEARAAYLRLVVHHRGKNMSDDKLIDLYRQAVFEVETDDGRISIVLGAANPAVDALLDTRQVRGGWAFITAWNPGDERPPTAVNERAQALLEAQCREAGLQVWRGDGASPDRKHVEPSILVAPIDLASASALGRAFRQRAIVVGAVGEPTTLVDLDAAP